MSTKRAHKKSFALLAAIFMLSAHSYAIPISFVFEGVGSFEVDDGITDQTYSDVSFQFFGTGDTENRGSYANGFDLVLDSLTLDIGGVGLFDIVSATSVFLNTDFQVFGLSDDVNAVDLILFFNVPALATYDLLSPLGPIDNADAFFSEFPILIASGGESIGFDDSVDATVSFAAVTAVPDSSVSLIGSLTLVTMMLLRRRRKA